jgi:hypothetical protein
VLNIGLTLEPPDHDRCRPSLSRRHLITAAGVGMALRWGEVDAIADGDPNIYLIQQRDRLSEVYNNLCGDYEHRVCCILGVRGSLIREDRPTATALTRELIAYADDLKLIEVLRPSTESARFAARIYQDVLT